MTQIDDQVSNDPDAFRAVGPDEAITWMAGHGWRRSAELGQVAALYARGDLRVLVPLLADSPDFGLRWTDMLSQIAAASGTQPATVLLEMIREGSDVAEFRASGPSLRDNSIPLVDAEQLIKSVRQMVAASANAVVQPRSHFGGSHPRVVLQHTRNIRMGQTRPGSYVVPIISPVPILRPDDGEDAEENALFADAGYVPFARQAMRSLAGSLGLLQQMAASPDIPSGAVITENVGQGVSYELCSAVATALEADAIDQVDVSFNWSPRIPTAGEVATAVTFPASSVDQLNRLSEILRNRLVVGEQTLTGYVKSLDRGEDETQGKVTIRALVNDKPRLVSMLLDPGQYERAGNANQLRAPVTVTGRLERESGRPLRFSEILDFGQSQHLPFLV